MVLINYVINNLCDEFMVELMVHLKENEIGEPKVYNFCANYLFSELFFKQLELLEEHDKKLMDLWFEFNSTTIDYEQIDKLQ